MDRNGSGAVDFAAVAEATRRRDQELAQRIKDALERPYVVETLNVAGVAARQEGDQRFLSIATPDGKRRDVPINTVVEQSLRMALFPRSNAEAA